MTSDLVIAVAGIVIGVVTSYIFYRIQKRRRELCWSIDSTSLIKGYSSLFEKLEIQYGGQKIENLTVSKIVFWNNGNETIDGKDIAIPPFILPRDTTNTEILDAKIIKTSTIGNRFEIRKKSDDPILFLHFAYLDPQQGAVVQVIHTGISILPLVVDGEVKGVKEIKFKLKKPDLVSQMPRFFIYFNGLLLLGLLGGFLYDIIFRGTPAKADWYIWVLTIVLIFTFILAVIDIRQARGTAKIPKGLSEFEKDDLGIRRRG